MGKNMAHGCVNTHIHTLENRPHKKFGQLTCPKDIGQRR